MLITSSKETNRPLCVNCSLKKVTSFKAQVSSVFSTLIVSLGLMIISTPASHATPSALQSSDLSLEQKKLNVSLEQDYSNVSYADLRDKTNDGESSFTLAKWSSLMSKHSSFRAQVIQYKEIYGILVPLGTGSFLNHQEYSVYYQQLPLNLFCAIKTNKLQYAVANKEPTILSKENNGQIFRLISVIKSIISGNSEALERNFKYSLKGHNSSWQLTLVPKSERLKSLYKYVVLTGSSFISTIKLIDQHNESLLLEFSNINYQDLEPTPLESSLLDF